MADSEPKTHAREDEGPEDDSHHGQPARKRQRVRLSCLECRRRKLSCSRELPCDRCIKSLTPDRCAYESRNGTVELASSLGSFTPVNASAAAAQDARRLSPLNPIRDTSSRRLDSDISLQETAKDHDRIRRLEVEVAQLRSALAKQVSAEGTTVAGSPSTLRDGSKESPVFTEALRPTSDGPVQESGDGLEYAFLRGHNFKTRYYGPHNTWASFKELSGIYPFMKETAESWLRPLNINKKDRQKRKEDREKYFLQPDASLEALLPPKPETDSLIAVYLDHFEQLHRIIHVPTFRNEYKIFWYPGQTICASFTALVLAIISVSCCLEPQATSKFSGVKSNAFETAEKWIKACEGWLEKQSQKHRRLVHFQIMCVLWLSKRVNVVKKKRYWTSAGALIRDGISVGLHQDPEKMSHKITPYYREMRKRIWSTMMEFDLQASFEQGVPSLLSLISNEANTPRNIDDEGFEEFSTELPLSKPQSEYTFTSYQHLSRQSLHVRVELNRILTSSLGDLDWEQVTRIADMITQEIDALPAWDLESKEESSHKPLLAHTLLHLQLKQCLIPLYQPFLKHSNQNSKYQVAEFIYYNTARDIVLMHDRLFQKGIRALYFLREDTVNAAVNLCNVTLHQPKNSTGLILSNANETFKLIEKCLAIKEDRILRCGNNDPWAYSSMCAAFGLLETHLGLKTSDAAKASAAERFISLHYKLLAYQQVPPFATPQAPSSAPQAAHESVNRAKSITPFPLDGNVSMQVGVSPLHNRDGLPLSMPWILPSSDPNQMLVPNPDFDMDAFGMDLNELWVGDEETGWT